MRNASLAIVLGAGAALFLLSRQSAEPSARGDDAIPQDDFTGPPDWLAGEEVGPPDWASGPLPDVPMPDTPVYDPRDASARRSPSELVPSEALRDWLRRKERFTPNRYELGDGGYTIGYGWFEAYGTPGADAMPLVISEPDARAKFNEQVETRGAAWVRRYVMAPVNQSEFDALTSMAFNLSPRSFKQIADALNAGEDWQAVAMQFTRPGTNLERGLVNRRLAEFRIFEEGVYA